MPHTGEEKRKTYMKEYSARYYKRNKKRLNAYGRRRYFENRKLVLAGMKIWYAENREAVGTKRQLVVNKRKGILPTRKAPKRCECCRKKYPNRLHVDHCHVRKKFRGWLCFKCNAGIGLLGDTLKALRMAARYLEKTR